MKYETKNKTKEEMKQILEDRGMIVDDISILDNINYAHLIYKYSKPFYEEEGIYKDGTRLSDLMNLFKINEAICAWLYKKINEFEHKLKNTVATIASAKSAFEYLDKEFYGEGLTKLKFYNKKEFNDFLWNIKKLHDKTLKNSEYLSGKTKDDIIPLWIFIDEMTIGQIRMFLKYWPDALKVYHILNLDFTHLSTFNTYRNRVFHMNPITKKIIIRRDEGKNIKHTFKKFFYVVSGTYDLKELEIFIKDNNFDENENVDIIKILF